MELSFPRHSMYGLFTYIWVVLYGKCRKYTIHYRPKTKMTMVKQSIVMLVLGV